MKLKDLEGIIVTKYSQLYPWCLLWNYKFGKDGREHINDIQKATIEYLIKKYPDVEVFDISIGNDSENDIVLLIQTQRSVCKCTEDIKEEYLNSSDVVMSEFLENKYYYLPADTKRELLKWSGDDEYVKVTDEGELIIL